MKKLPIGKQTLTKLVEEECIYVDKTEIIYQMISEGSAYFLSRPRRFGKSLLVDTLKQVFLGNKPIFKGLWIEDKIDWNAYPVIHIDFSGTGYKEKGLRSALTEIIKREAKYHHIEIVDDSYDQLFRALITKLSEQQPVVVLIDEYDKPVIDYLDNVQQALENRDILKNFFSVLKPLDQHLKFIFITGVSKFSHVSIFSDLNHLRDITLSTQFASLLGITQNEVTTYFAPYLQKWENHFGGGSTLLEYIKYWYNGYSWDGTSFVYNPFSLINFFAEGQFNGFWFRTGTPTFLSKLVKANNTNVPELESFETQSFLLDKFEIDNLDLISVLFQTGYLTIKKIANGTLTLGYPNFEVKQAWYSNLLAVLNEGQMYENETIVRRMKKALENGDTETFMLLMKSVFSSLTYQQIEKKENYFHSIFFLVIKMLGFETESEILSSFGRIDVAIFSGNLIYIIEFKLSTAIIALNQIKSKRYIDKYLASGKKIHMLGIGFDAEKRTIADWVEEKVM